MLSVIHAECFNAYCHLCWVLLSWVSFLLSVVMLNVLSPRSFSTRLSHYKFLRQYETTHVLMIQYQNCWEFTIGNLNVKVNQQIFIIPRFLTKKYRNSLLCLLSFFFKYIVLYLPYVESFCIVWLSGIIKTPQYHFWCDTSIIKVFGHNRMAIQIIHLVFSIGDFCFV